MCLHRVRLVLEQGSNMLDTTWVVVVVAAAVVVVWAGLGDLCKIESEQHTKVIGNKTKGMTIVLAEYRWHRVLARFLLFFSEIRVSWEEEWGSRIAFISGSLILSYRNCQDVYMYLTVGLHMWILNMPA